MAPEQSFREFAQQFDHTLAAPQLTDSEIVEGLHLARRYGTGCALVRPCDLDLAVRTLQGSGVLPGALCAFPHGSQNTAAKLYEARDLLRRGAKAIDMVIGISKLLSREFQHVQTELLQMAESCHKEGATLTVTLETPYLTEELKIIACRCAERAEADFVATATGYAPAPSSPADIPLLRKHVPDEMGVKAGPVTSLEEALAALAAGATRLGSAHTAEILDAWKAQQPPTQNVR